MEIIDLKAKQFIAYDSSLNKIYVQFGELLSELKKKKLSQNIITTINDSVLEINASLLSEKALQKLIKQQQTIILKKVEKEHKIVPINYNRNLWALLGFTAFGLPIGTAIGLSMDNIGLLGLGLPLGMAIGFFIGVQMDKLALKQDRQLNIEIKM